jgi:hypothetical protein
MADKDLEDDGPSLELPSFAFGRTKKARESAPAAPVKPVVETDPGPEPGSLAEAETTVTPPAAETVTSRVDDDEAAETPVDEPRAGRGSVLTALPALQAALVVGALVGLLAVLLTFASLKLCELLRGTDSCGGPGLLLLVATLVVLTYVGGWLLRGFGIDDPGSTSFLAVGLLAVLTMLFLLDVIYSWWMVVVIPVVAMATYALSWWVTTRFVDVGD